MHKYRLLAIPLVMFFLLACGLASGIQQLQSAATQLPGILTSMPTAMGALETSAAVQSPNSSACSTPTSAGLGITLDSVKAVLQITQQVAFTDTTVNGKQVSTATLASLGATTFPTIASGFSGQFIGDPCNLSEIVVTVPRTDSQTTIDEGIGVINALFATFMPPEVQLGLLPWLSQNYSTVPLGGQVQTTISTMNFTLQRTATNNMVLDIIPAK